MKAKYTSQFLRSHLSERSISPQIAPASMSEVSEEDYTKLWLHSTKSVEWKHLARRLVIYARKREEEGEEDDEARRSEKEIIMGI